MSEDNIKPWDRQQTESDAAWDAFRRYLDKGADRTLRSVSDELQIHLPQVQKWSKANHWEYRVRAWNRSQDREIKRRHREALRALADSHRGVGRALTGKALQALKSLNPDHLKPSDVVSMLRLGTDLQRNSYSYATEDLEKVQIISEAAAKKFEIDPNDFADDLDDAVESFEDMLR